MPHVNGRLEDKDDTNIDACLEQLARAISAHVTDILIERLGLEERSVQTQETSTAMDLTPVSTVAKPPVSDRPQHINLKPSTSRSVPCTVRSLPQSPTTCRKAPPTRRGNDFGPHYGERSERTAGRRKGDAMVRYHSENRLNRIEAERSGNETPLENRASRLRRASISKRLAGAGGRLIFENWVGCLTKWTYFQVDLKDYELQ
ncbi:hypothetical protein ANCCAN_06044 [Ancylostoma caninum]|uniref:Uncharacterized protein n=1 Tax=Ancylostoma caninum TaxID=29170 RepID=A0A368GXX2_ANCCA|nr:hypothetical protein ANCCAN_06044 [Ancylostoma caninum]